MEVLPKMVRQKRRKIIAFSAAVLATCASAGAAVGANVGLLRLGSVERVGHLADSSASAVGFPTATTVTTNPPNAASVVPITVIDTVVKVQSSATTSSQAPLVPFVPAVTNTLRPRSAQPAATTTGAAQPLPTAPTSVSPTPEASAVTTTEHHSGDSPKCPTGQKFDHGKCTPVEADD